MNTASLPVRRIVSGGQTGVDRGALDAAIALDLEHGGWCPANRRAEDGRIPQRYQLRSTMSPDYKLRTEKNVIDSDGTLILCRGGLSGGTLLTREYTRQYDRPCRVVDLAECDEETVDRPVALVADWLLEHGITVLNVAGPRESQNRGIAAAAKTFIMLLFGASR